MTTDWRDKLVEDFPLLYSSCQYFETPDSWQHILRTLSEKLEPLIRQYMKDNTDPWLDVDTDDGVPCAVQVKEKFGGLRFYMNYTTEAMDEAIRQAEERVQLSGVNY